MLHIFKTELADPSHPCLTHRFSIAEAALDGLKPDKFAAMAATSGSGPSSASGTSSTAAAAAAVAAVEFPGFESLLAFLLTEHRQLGRPVEEGAQLPLPAKVRRRCVGCAIVLNAFCSSIACCEC